MAARSATASASCPSEQLQYVHADTGEFRAPRTLISSHATVCRALPPMIIAHLRGLVSGLRGTAEIRTPRLVTRSERIIDGTSMSCSLLSLTVRVCVKHSESVSSIQYASGQIKPCLSLVPPRSLTVLLKHLSITATLKPNTLEDVVPVS
ncbi:hypothetical protein AAFF_G00306500 [Aldrovandia affinis]|uniref:Uncharacterized protein n=1 Tax=Aldrovandia affinis TaxID=143900 RepID=A0AAD7SPC7_9TELE|nr:hypothetical protein AAFF_G00306500 [Aldrovandia affinis]